MVKLDQFTTEMLEIAKHDYEQFIKSYGFNSAYTIQYGLEYAKMLRNAARGIEAERPFRSWQQTAAACTVQSTTALNVHIKILRYAMRWVVVSPVPDDDKVFQALRYENGGELCVVTGPITKPRQVDNERVFHAASDLIVPYSGCPVICHGLISACHLNGEVEEPRALHNNRTGFTL